MDHDAIFMQRAIDLARLAAAQREVPVGAVLVYENQIIGEGYNQPISLQDPTAHAEIIALRNGAKNLNNYRLINTTLYVTLEPCLMCLGAMVHARIKRLVFGANDLKTGSIESAFNLINSPCLNHRIDFSSGLMQETCGELLSEFFRAKR